MCRSTKYEPELDEPELNEPQLDEPELDEPELNEPELDEPELNEKPELDKADRNQMKCQKNSNLSWSLRFSLISIDIVYLQKSSSNAVCSKDLLFTFAVKH